MSDPSVWVEEDKLSRHRRERVDNGFSEYDWWNANSYLSWVNIQMLEKFKNGAGFPADLNNMDEWRELLDKMIDGFKAFIEYFDMDYETVDDGNAILDRHRAGMKIYAERFISLWD